MLWFGLVMAFWVTQVLSFTSLTFVGMCFHRHNEAYTWTNPTCCVHNVILGQLWIEQYGIVEIVNHR